MKNKVYRAFDAIKADDELKKNTYQFLKQKPKPKRNIPVKRFAIALALIILASVASFVSYDLYSKETAYLDLDVNPSIELTLNRFDQVISAYGYNEEGKEVLKQADVKNKSYQEALEKIIEVMKEKDYLDKAELFTATLQMNDSSAEKKKIRELEKYLAKLLKTEAVSGKNEVFAVDEKTKTTSHHENITPAKYLAILELQEADPTATIEGCKGHSISEIKEQTRAHHGKAGTAEDTPATDDSDDADHKSEAGHHGQTQQATEQQNEQAQPKAEEHSSQNNANKHGNKGGHH